MPIDVLAAYRLVVFKKLLDSVLAEVLYSDTFRKIFYLTDLCVFYRGYESYALAVSRD